MKARILLVTAALLSTSVLAEEPLATRLETQKQQYQQASDDANLARTALETDQIELKSAQSKLQSFKTERDNERTKLDDLRSAAEKMPTIDFTDQINRQNDAVYKAGRKYQSQLDNVKTLEEKVHEDKTRYAIAAEQQKSLKMSIDSMHEQLAGAELQKRLQGINKSRNINVEVRETCSLQLTQAACRDQAKAKAERQAAEKGSVVMVESVTEIKNFNMTKDEIKSRLKVRISNIQVTRDSYDLTADKTGWVVDYAITATVTPVITEDMRKDMKAQILAELSGDWNPDESELDTEEDTAAPMETEGVVQPIEPGRYKAPVESYTPPPAPVYSEPYQQPKPKSTKNFGAW